MMSYFESLKASLFSPDFLKDAFERATKTALQAASLVIGQQVGGFDLFTVNGPTLAGFAAGGFIISLATSIASALLGGTISPASLVKEPQDY